MTPDLLVAAHQMLRVFWSAIFVGVCALVLLGQGQAPDAIALLCGAAGLGQALYTTHKAREAATLARAIAVEAKDHSERIVERIQAANAQAIARAVADPI